MSYRKAMRHARNPRKMKIRSRMHFGFDACSGPSLWSNPVLVVGEWFKRRWDGDPQYNRECIREQIAKARAYLAEHAKAVNPVTAQPLVTSP